MRNVKMFVDFWNFTLRWNEHTKPDATSPNVRLGWERMPSVLMAELPTIFGTSDPLGFKGIHVFASVDPRPGSSDEKLKRWLHHLSSCTGYQVQVRDRKHKRDHCPHCTKDIERMVEKGVDTAIMTALFEGALNDSYDIAVLLSNDTDHIPAINAIQDRLNKQIVHVGFKRGGAEIRTATWSHIILDGALTGRLSEPPVNA